MRALSILFVVVNIYWFCYEAIFEWRVDISVVDRILLNFNRTAALFESILWTKLFAVVFLALSCLGTKGVKNEKITWGKICVCAVLGMVLLFIPPLGNAVFYIFTMAAGYICMLMAGVWMSRMLKSNLMSDVFNNENESFRQEMRLLTNEY